MLAGWLPVAQRRQASEAGCLIIALNLRSIYFIRLLYNRFKYEFAGKMAEGALGKKGCQRSCLSTITSCGLHGIEHSHFIIHRY